MPPNQKRVDQRTNIRFMVAKGLKPIEIWRELRTVFGDATISKTQVRVWCKHFAGGDQGVPVSDKPRSGHPRRRAEHVEEIRALVEQDRRMTIAELSEETGVNPASVQRILKRDLKLTKLSAKFVPHQLTPEQRQTRKDMCDQNLRKVRHCEDFLDRIVTGDETWVPLFDPETKQSSCEWRRKGSKGPVKVRKSRAQKKTMLILFYDQKGVVHLEFLPQGETVDTDYYLEVLKCLKESVRRKRPDLWKRQPGTDTRTMLLHHDNASCHTATRTLALIRESGIDMVSHPPYSPDLAPCDFWAFPFLKNHLRGHKFQSINDVQTAVRRVFRECDQKLFRESLQDLPSRWMKCSVNEGAYFEGQNVQIPDHMSVTESKTSSEEE